MQVQGVLENLAVYIDTNTTRHAGGLVERILHEVFGGRYLGAGAFSTVFEIDELPGMAVKLCTSNDMAWLSWALHCMVHKPSFGPEIHGIYRGDTYYIAIMPKYRPVEYGPDYYEWEHRMQMLLRKVFVKADHEERAFIQYLCMTHVYEDYKSANVMRTDDGRFVMTDPVYEGRPTEYIDAMKRMASELDCPYKDKQETSRARRLERTRQATAAEQINAVEPLRAKPAWDGGKIDAIWNGWNDALFQVRKNRVHDLIVVDDTIGRGNAIEERMRELVNQFARDEFRFAYRPKRGVQPGGIRVDEQIRDEWARGALDELLREFSDRAALHAYQHFDRERQRIVVRVASEGTKRPIAQVSVEQEHRPDRRNMAIATALDELRRQLRLHFADGGHSLRVANWAHIPGMCHIGDFAFAAEDRGPSPLIDPPSFDAGVARRGWGGGPGPPQGPALLEPPRN